MKVQSTDLVALNCSWGTQSSALLWMVLLGHIDKPANFVVLTADPGWEHPETYKYARLMRARCLDAGIKCLDAKGPDLCADLLSINASTTRLDSPPLFFPRNEGGTGQTMQKCTRHYKLRPMDRAIRAELKDRGIDKPRPQSVERWIGFAADEYPRSQRIRWENSFNVARFPLIEMRLRKEAVHAYYRAHNLPLPPRSVCNGCPANAPAHYRKLRQEHPAAFADVVRIDEGLRGIGAQIGLDGGEDKQDVELYLSSTVEPIAAIAADDYETKGQMGFPFLCDQGACFV